MELVKVVCTTCGNNLQTKEDTSAITCEYCGNTFLMSNGLDFALKTDEEIGSIKKLRNNLQRSVLADDHKNILEFSKEVLRLIPKDDLANYYFAYANYSFGSRRYLFDFYDHTVQIPKDTTTVIEHIIAYSDVRDRNLIENFIARHNPNLLETYRKKYQQKLIDEENYSSIPRDVFISFRSTEIEIATEVLNVIEGDGSSCWISSRNLRPNDNQNYWANIEDAISKCKIFLVVSSHEAMISRDVKKELDFATKQKKNRIEFKVDTARHTTLFKYFFDGCKWIDASENKEDALVELKKRAYTMLNETSTKIHSQSKKQNISDSDSSDFIRKMNRAQVDMIGSNFKEASDSIKDALGIDPESSEAWWTLFLAENNFQSTELFLEYVSKKQTLSKMADLFNKVSYKQYKKHAPKDSTGMPANARKFEKYLYDDIVSYLNKPNLPNKSKRDYLHSYVPNHILTMWADNILRKEVKTDAEVNFLIDDPDRIKELENIFDDFEDLKVHPSYNESHIKVYSERFYNNYDKVLEKRKTNLKELKELTNKLYDDLDDLLDKRKFKQAYDRAQELFYLDNSSDDKYMYLLLTKLKSRNTQDLYDSLLKLRKKEKQKILNSVTFEKLYRSEKYSHIMDDIILHLNYKKVKKNNRILMKLRGEDNEM
jgi:ribosomal protein S27E